jgi:hypothetical protein
VTQRGGAQRHQDVGKTGAAQQVALSEAPRGPVITIARFNPWLSSLLSLLRSEKIGGNTWAIKPSEYFDQYVARFHPAKMSRGSEFCQS